MNILNLPKKWLLVDFQKQLILDLIRYISDLFFPKKKKKHIHTSFFLRVKSLICHLHFVYKLGTLCSRRPSFQNATGVIAASDASDYCVYENSIPLSLFASIPPMQSSSILNSLNYRPPLCVFPSRGLSREEIRFAEGRYSRKIKRILTHRGQSMWTYKCTKNGKTGS